MLRRNYPLTALRSFEAAARSLSLKKAAEELHVTSGAVSQQIKMLENYLDTQLFQRFPNRIELTDTAQVLLPQLSDVFLHLDQAVENIVGDQASQELNISAGPLFTTKWLIPRLEKFNAIFPNITLRVSSSLLPVDFKQDSIDAAIRFNAGAGPGLKKITLFEEHLTPMCSPSLIKGRRKLKSLEDLNNFTLIHNDMLEGYLGKPAWQFWLERFNNHNVNWTGGPHFSQPDHAAQSALDGVGVILGCKHSFKFDLAQNRLIAPFKSSLPIGCSFGLVYPEKYASRRKIIAFQEWLLNEIKSDHR